MDPIAVSRPGSGVMAYSNGNGWYVHAQDNPEDLKDLWGDSIESNSEVCLFFRQLVTFHGSPTNVVYDKVKKTIKIDAIGWANVLRLGVAYASITIEVIDRVAPKWIMGRFTFEVWRVTASGVQSVGSVTEQLPMNYCYVNWPD